VAGTSPDVPEMGHPAEEAEEGRGLLLDLEVKVTYDKSVNAAYVYLSFPS
jgi:hypothetical protein